MNSPLQTWVTSTILLALSLLSPPAAADALLPDSFDVVYRLSQAGITLAELKRKGQREQDGSYTIRSVAEPRGLAAWILDGDTEESSRWTLRDGRVVPLHYVYRENAGHRRKRMHLEYDWQRGSVIDRDSGKRWELPPDAQDQTSIQFAIMHRLHRGEREFHYSLLDGKRIRSRHYRVTERRILETRVGRVEVVGVREVKPEGKRYTLFWCAPRFGYLPVRVEQHKRGAPSLITVVERINGFPDHPVKPDLAAAGTQ